MCVFISIAIGFVLIVVMGLAVVSFMGYLYDANHAIPNPAMRGDDLGAGLIMIVAAISSLLASIPLAIFISIVIFRKY